MLLLEIRRYDNSTDVACDDRIRELYPYLSVKPLYVALETYDGNSHQFTNKKEPLFHYAVIEDATAEDLATILLRGFIRSDIEYWFDPEDNKYYITPECLTK